MGTATLKTLPTICVEEGFKLDAMRRLIRRTPELRRLGHNFGSPCKLYSADEVKLLRDAYEARKKPETLAVK